MLLMGAEGTQDEPANLEEALKRPDGKLWQMNSSLCLGAPGVAIAHSFCCVSPISPDTFLAHACSTLHTSDLCFYHGKSGWLPSYFPPCHCQFSLQVSPAAV